MKKFIFVAPEGPDSQDSREKIYDLIWADSLDEAVSKYFDLYSSTTQPIIDGFYTSTQSDGLSVSRATFQYPSFRGTDNIPIEVLSFVSEEKSDGPQ